MQSEPTVGKQSAESLVYDEDDNEADDSLADKYLLFNLGNEVYGIDIKYVIEIIELQKITEVPDMPEYIKGVINLRGKIIPAMDLRIRFSIVKRAYNDRNCIIIVKVADKPVGLIVDTVEDVQDIPIDSIEPAPDFKSDAGKERFTSGLAKDGDNVRIILDAEKTASIKTGNLPVGGTKEVTDEE